MGNKLSAILNLKKIIFGHVTVIKFQICCCVQNFIKIGEIWQCYDFKYGGNPPSLHFEISKLCHVTSIAMLLCFIAQNFTEIEQSGAE